MNLLKTAAAALALLMLPLAAQAAAQPSRMLTTEPGVQIHVVAAGPANARPALVLVPGWTMPASIWRDQLAAFSGERRVVALAPRSQGESTKALQGNTPDGRARDLKAVLDQLHLDRIVLVGWSQGVQDVAGYVNQFGTGRLAGVVLVDSSISDGAKGAAKTPEATGRQLSLLDLYARAPADYERGMLDAIIVTP